MIRRLAIILATSMAIALPAIPATAAAEPAGPIDPDASAAVRELLANLQDAGNPELEGGFLFGQQHANWDSKRLSWTADGWSDWRSLRVRLDELNTFPSDIELATSLDPATSGSKPAVYGFNLRLALRLNGEQRESYARQIVAAYATGAVVTLHFPADNPATGGTNKDVRGNPLCALSNDWSNPPAAAAPTIAAWTAELQEASSFIDELNRQWRDPDRDGVNERSGTVALVFRPLHEMTGVTNWWAGAFYRADRELCSLTAPQAYRTVWRRTVEYLIGADDPATTYVEGVNRHELLFAWSPGRPTNTVEWRKYHPNLRLGGRWALVDYVDVAGVDVYESNLAAFKSQLIDDVTAMHQFVESQARAKRDVLAVTEFGARKGFAGRTDANWYQSGLLESLVAAGVADHIAYVMTWTNRTDDQFWVPMACFNAAGCPTLAGFDQRYGTGPESSDNDWGFSEFVADPLTILERDLPDWWRMPEPRLEPYMPTPPRGPHGWRRPSLDPR